MNPSYDPQTFQVRNESISSYTAKTFGWMFLGLMTTFAASLAIYFTGAIWYLYNSILPYVLLIAEIGIVVYLSARLHKLKSSYCCIWGLLPQTHRISLYFSETGQRRSGAMFSAEAAVFRPVHFPKTTDIHRFPIPIPAV